MYEVRLKKGSSLGFCRDGILHEPRKYARGTNLTDCGKICGSHCKSVGLIEEIWKEYSK